MLKYNSRKKERRNTQEKKKVCFLSYVTNLNDKRLHNNNSERLHKRSKHNTDTTGKKKNISPRRKAKVSSFFVTAQRRKEKKSDSRFCVLC